MRKNKEGALELSIGTIVVIVIGMSMLILGLVLVQKIFKGSTQSIDSINEQVLNEIVNLFGDDSGNLLIKLGSTNSVTVKPGDEFGVAMGAQHPDGESITRETIQFRIQLDESNSDNCFRRLGKSGAEDLFITPINIWNNLDRFTGSTGAALIQIRVPDNTPVCSQKVNVDVKLKDAAQPFEGNFFVLNVGKKGIL